MRWSGWKKPSDRTSTGYNWRRGEVERRWTPERREATPSRQVNIKAKQAGDRLMDRNEVPDVGPDQLDAVLRFLPVFEQPDYTFGEWHSPRGQFPFYAVNAEVMDFLQTLDEQQIVFPFDWPRWQEEAGRYVSDPGALEMADLLTLRKLLTTHVRTERFVEGHLANMLESGHITAILRRLQIIRRQMSKRQERC